LGWIEARNIRIDIRWGTSDPDQMRASAKDLVDLKPEMIVGTSSPAIVALLQQTKTIPIVFLQVVDPLGRGFVSNMARPGGNVTGFLNFEFSMGGKWLETLKQVAPGIKRVALVFNQETAPFSTSFVQVVQEASHSFAVEATAIPVRDASELEHKVTEFAAEPNGGLIIVPDLFNTTHREAIVALAARHRLPAVYPFRYFASSGGLISDGVDTVDLFRRSAQYVDRILKGANPGELPIQAPTKFELVVNLKTATALGLTVPQSLLALADEVIE
jgi:putative ABC transport system substrate-binding protein